MLVVILVKRTVYIVPICQLMFWKEVWSTVWVNMVQFQGDKDSFQDFDVFQREKKQLKILHFATSITITA